MTEPKKTESLSELYARKKFERSRELEQKGLLNTKQLGTPRKAMQSIKTKDTRNAVRLANLKSPLGSKNLEKTLNQKAPTGLLAAPKAKTMTVAEDKPETAEQLETESSPAPIDTAEKLINKGLFFSDIFVI